MQARPPISDYFFPPHSRTQTKNCLRQEISFISIKRKKKELGLKRKEGEEKELQWKPRILEDLQGPHEGPTSDHITQALRDVLTHLCVV